MINWIKNIFKKCDKMSFKAGLELTELPVVTFYQGTKKLNFMLDTGANVSIIDSNILDDIECNAINRKAKIFGVEGNCMEAGYVRVEFTYNNNLFSDIMQTVDMSSPFSKIKKESGVQLHGLIGNAFMQKYKYILDFNEMIAYSKL